MSLASSGARTPIWVDSDENMYVGEVLEGQRIQKFARTK